MKRLFVLSFVLFAFSLLSAMTLYLDCKDEDMKSYLISQIKSVKITDIKESADVFTIIKDNSDNKILHYTIVTFGQNDYAGLSDTIDVVYTEDVSDYTVYEHLYKTLIIAILDNYAENEMINNISLIENKIQQEGKVQEENLRGWNFKLQGNMNLYAEQNYKREIYQIHMYASKYFYDNEIRFDASGLYHAKEFVLDSNTVYTSNSQSISSDIEYIKAIDSHFSGRVKFSFLKSTYSNYYSESDLSAGIEYSVFPYIEGNTRLLKLSYEYEPSYAVYNDITIYDKNKELLHRNILRISYDMIFPKGSATISCIGRGYFVHYEQFSLFASTSARLYIVKGLALNIYGEVFIPRDQRNIVKTGYSDEEILLLQRQMQTDYIYNFTIGLSYSWGSKYKNIQTYRF